METLNTTDAAKRLYETSLPLFTIKSLRDILDIASQDTFFLYLRKLARLGIIKKLERGTYILAHRPPDVFLIANVLYRPSYVSFESALSRHGILSQFSYEITSATVNKAMEKTVEERIYSYTHIQPSLFWGYEKTGEALIALPEKALLDQAYLASRGQRQFPLDEYDVSSINKNQLTAYMKRMPNTAQMRAILLKIRKEVFS